METLKLDWDVHAAGLAVLTLNRPNALNAMNTQMMKELLNLFREQAYNDGLRCMIMTGAGDRSFSTGGDLKEVVRAILKDPEAGYGNGGADLSQNQGHLREPVLYATALLRALGATYVLDPPLNDSTISMGQDLFNAPSVFNYYSPFYRLPGKPTVAPEFQILSQSTAFARTNFAYRAIHNAISHNIIVDVTNFRKLAADKTVLLNAVSQALLGKPINECEQSNAILGTASSVVDAGRASRIGDAPVAKPLRGCHGRQDLFVQGLLVDTRLAHP